LIKMSSRHKAWNPPKHTRPDQTKTLCLSRENCSLRLHNYVHSCYTLHTEQRSGTEPECNTVIFEMGRHIDKNNSVNGLFSWNVKTEYHLFVLQSYGTTCRVNKLCLTVQFED
jgi:hypothetical protein